MRLDGQNPPDKSLLEPVGEQLNSIQQWDLRTVDRRGSPQAGSSPVFGRIKVAFAHTFGIVSQAAF